MRWALTQQFTTKRRGLDDETAKAKKEDSHSNPIRVISFNVSEGWSRDSSEDIADELRQRIAQRDEVPPSLEDFVARYGTDTDIQLTLL